MQNMGGGSCPFTFNFDPATFAVGDIVSYRVPDRFDDFPFVGILAEVHADHVVINPNDPEAPHLRWQATRESRPVVRGAEMD